MDTELGLIGPKAEISLVISTRLGMRKRPSDPVFGCHYPNGLDRSRHIKMIIDCLYCRQDADGLQGLWLAHIVVRGRVSESQKMRWYNGYRLNILCKYNPLLLPRTGVEACNGMQRDWATARSCSLSKQARTRPRLINNRDTHVPALTKSTLNIDPVE